MRGGLGHHTPEQNAARLASISGMRRIHKCMGIFILLLTASNILSGLVQRQLTCAYQRRWRAYGCLYRRISKGLAVMCYDSSVHYGVVVC
jgi:hypothetical protein